MHRRGLSAVFALYQNLVKTLSETDVGVLRRAKSRFPRLLEKAKKTRNGMDGLEGSFTRQGSVRIGPHKRAWLRQSAQFEGACGLLVRSAKRSLQQKSDRRIVVDVGTALGATAQQKDSRFQALAVLGAIYEERDGGLCRCCKKRIPEEPISTKSSTAESRESSKSPATD
jgi:hypothetical protein